jgi:hypothetical protein
MARHHRLNRSTMSDTTNETPERRESVGRDEILHRFGYHAASTEGPNATAPIHADVRRLFIELAEHMDHLLPPGRAKALAFTELESAMHWANSAIAMQAPLVTDR